jgi:DNA-binding transcriptional LysR family regulator
MERDAHNKAQAEPPDRVRTTVEPAIQLRHLRYFLMVSEELHFGHAAERLHMAQPPLSQAIRKLEEELGVQLLARTSRTTTLTEAGRVFAKHARRVLAALDLAIAETRRVDGKNLDLQVGYAPYLPLSRLLDFLDELHQREPQLQPQVNHLVGSEQIRRLRRSELDVGIFPMSPGGLPNLQTQPLFPGEQLVAFVRAEDPLAEQPVLRPHDVANETLVSFRAAQNPALAVWLSEQMERAGYRFRERHEIGGDIRDSVLAVAEGRGLALLPRSARPTKEESAIVVARPLEPPLLMPDTVIAWRTRPPFQLRALTGELRELASQLHETTAGDEHANGDR